MDTTISNEEIQQVLNNCWEDIACFAYESYHTNGRGLWAWKKQILREVY